ELGEGVGVALSAGHILAANIRVVRLLLAIERLEDHAELQIGGEVLRLASQQLPQLVCRRAGVALPLELQRQRVAGKGIVGRAADELTKLADAVHASLIARRNRSRRRRRRRRAART